MSINGIIGSSFSALQANQRALDAVSTNVANLNTDGYARLDPNFVSGHVRGVDARIERAADAFLDAASWRATADSVGARTTADILDRAQALFGDPSGTGFVFAALDDISASLDALALDPSSRVRRDQAVGAIVRQFERLEGLTGHIGDLRTEVASGVATAVDEINTLIEGISRLNSAVTVASISHPGGNEALTEQGILIDRLSALIDIKVQRNDLGAAEIRTGSGLILVGSQAPARIVTLSPPAGARYGALGIQQNDESAPLAMRNHVRGGQLKSLLGLRDRTLPDLSAAVAELARGLADSLNAASNQGSAFPPPQTLAGINTGFLSGDSHRFSGKTRIGITDADGRLQRQILIDFDGGQVIDQASGTRSAIGDTIGSLVSALDTALGGHGSASFAAGRLTISAASTAHGVVIADDANAPASRAGRGFSHSFGLNDLIVTGSGNNRATGLTASDAHGFAAGGTLRLGFRDASGAIVSTAQYTVSGTSMSDLVADLGSQISGRGRADLDADGRLTLTTGVGIADVVVLDDTTRRRDSAASLSDVFGLPRQVTAVAMPVVHPDIVSGSRGLAVAEARFAGVGTAAVAPGDGAGAARLSAALSNSVAFAPAGGLDGGDESVVARVARLAGHAGLLARAADSEASHTEAILNEITRRRHDHSGVNLDAELVRMTTYQQAYAAASRMMQAAQELYDTLLRIV